MTRRDLALVLGLFLAGLGSRIPFRSEYAYHWDSAQFALAIGHFDLAAGQPQAPGFPVYVGLGKLLGLVVAEPHARLVWLSVFAGALLPVAGYGLARAMGGRVCGLATAVILLTSPLAWFHSEVALTNVVSAGLGLAVVWACWQTWRAGPTTPRVLAMSLLLALLAGVRPQSALPLLVLWGIVWRGLRGWRARALLWLALGIALWLVPLLSSVGGLRSYAELLWLKARYDAEKTIWGGGWAALADSLRVIGVSLWMGLLLAAPFVALGFRQARREARLFLAGWLVPALLFGVLTYTTMPGYVLDYLPALALAAGLAVASRPTAPLLIAAIGLVNTAAFFAAPSSLTWRAIRDHDRKLRVCFAEIRSRFAPADVIIVHRGEWFRWGFRQFQYYLPEYRNVLLTPDPSLPGERGQRFWLGENGETRFVTELPRGGRVLEVDGARETLGER